MRRFNQPTQDTSSIKNLTGKKLYQAMLKDVAKIKWWLLLSAFLSIAGITMTVIAPKIMGYAIDVIDGFTKNGVIHFNLLTKLLLLLALVYVLSSAFMASKSVLLNHIVSRHFTCKLRIRMSEKIKSLPVQYVDTTKKGELIERMTEDVSVIGNTIHQVMDLAINGFLQLSAIVAVMFTVSWQLALVSVAIVPISTGISVVLAKRVSHYFDRYMKEIGTIYSHIDESYSGLKTIRAYGMEQRMKQRFDKCNREIRDVGRRGYFIVNMLQPFISLINKLGYVAISLIGGYLALTESVSIGAIVAIVMYSANLGDPLSSIAQCMAMLQRTSASAKRVYGMLALEEMQETQNAPTLSAGLVEFDHVNFGYTPEKRIITDLNLKVIEGQKIAIVGPTGGGKTTIVNLLMRFYEPTSGRIFVDGKDICTINRTAVRNLFGMVLQDTWLFSGSIADNIAYGKPSATREEIQAACDEAYCDRFIRTLDHGYDTQISEDATNISSGQKQLLTIARTFLANRPILILDEATSNVDTRTEILLQKAMDKLMYGKTCFVIAHRLSTIVNADLILVINEGNIVERGTHSELMEKQGFYYTIYQSQYCIK